MAKVTIVGANACRDCRLCIDKCPVQVFAHGHNAKGDAVAIVAQQEACMGCFACYYLCPSQCIEISEVARQRPFQRLDENVNFVRHFLQVEQIAQDLTQSDWEQAYRDVASTLLELARAVDAVFGFASEAIAHQAGVLVAPHFPELYEVEAFDERLRRLHQRLAHAFDFEAQPSGEDILTFAFSPCAIHRVVTDAGEQAGEAILCRLFHEFWAGLIGTMGYGEARCTLTSCGPTCHLDLNRRPSLSALFSTHSLSTQ